jgi:hypothetical protein
MMFGGNETEISISTVAGSKDEEKGRIGQKPQVV